MVTIKQSDYYTEQLNAICSSSLENQNTHLFFQQDSIKEHIVKGYYYSFTIEQTD
jgi:hypothetical protein